MKTYVTLTVSSEGAPASEINEKLKDMGFKTALGMHDYVYDWKGNDVASETVIGFVDKVQAALKGTGAMLHFTTR